MLISLLRGGNFADTFIYLASIAFVVFCTMPVHECAHAFAADRLGDKTARNQGRLTLNPLAHIAPLGVLMMLLVGFGYAKPVPVSVRQLKHPKRDFALVAIAGPISNLIMSLIFFFIANIVLFLMSASAFVNVILTFFIFAATINVHLAVFNLIPIPPLDGSRILSAFLPDKYYYKLLQYERYITIALFALLWLNILTIPLNFISDHIMRAMTYITGLPFGADIWYLIR